MNTVIILALCAIIYMLDAWSDAWFEKYKNDLITLGEEPPTAGFFSYSPTRKKIGPFGAFRDGWHTAKLISNCTFSAIIAILLPLPHWYCSLGLALAVWAIFFNLSLWAARKSLQ